MAVDLATSGSLGYGIGLQAKVPDKTGLVLQLENQRLKRQALKAQEEEQKAQKAAKKQEMFEKSLKIDTSKWHRTLVGKVQQAANEAFDEYNKLYEVNDRLAENSRNEIINRFQQKVGSLYTTNEDRKQFEKGYNEKMLRGEYIPQDQVEFATYLTSGDDASLKSPWQSSMGQFVVNPDSTTISIPIEKTNAPELAKSSADQYGTFNYMPTAMGVEGRKVYTDADVLSYMNNRYSGVQNSGNKIADVNAISRQLYAAYKAGGFDQAGMTFKDFTNLSDRKDPLSLQAADIVNSELLKYHKNLLMANAPAPRQVQLNERQELDNAASAIAREIFSTPGVDYITTTKQLPKDVVDKSWNAYTQTDTGKMVIAKAGGEKNARALFDTYLPQKEQQLRQLYKPSGVAGAKGEDWVIEDITAVRPKILNAQQLGSIRGKRAELSDREKRKAAGLDELILSEEEVVSGAEGYSGLEKETPSKQFRVDPTGMREAYFSVIPTTLNRVQGWSTGDTTPQYDIINGTFRSVLLDKQGNPKFIIIDEQEKPGERSNTWAVPFELNKSVLGGYSNLLEKKKPTTKPAQQKKAATTTTTKTKGLTGGNVR